MFRRSLVGMLSVVALLAAAAPQAETLLIEGLREARAGETQRPRRGMSMETVQSRFGDPVAKNAAVGDPPITRWEYPEFVVYFEYSRVIHAVRKL